MTVVTQFITSDGTDNGDLVEMRRLYVQDGKVVQNSFSDVNGKQCIRQLIILVFCFIFFPCLVCRVLLTKAIFFQPSNVLGVDSVDSITDNMCRQSKSAFNDIDDFSKKGGMKVNSCYLS